MKKYPRRNFLQLLTLGAGMLTLNRILTACGIKPASLSPTAAPYIPPATNTSIPSSQTPEPSATATNTPVPPPDLVVVRGGEPEQLAYQALDVFGGMKSFVTRGASVVIKPNICVAYHSYEYAATTNPWLVGALVKMAFEAGAGSVQVFDYPFGGSADEAYGRSGIEAQVKANGGDMVRMPSFGYVMTELPQARDLKKIRAYKDALDADVLINVPIAKHHSEAVLTLGMKNLMGLVLDRGAIHSNLGQRIADLVTLFQPDLTIVDAIRILTKHGPSGGNLGDVKKLDTLIVSRDIVAADSYATTLFGLQPGDIDYITAAADMGLGNSDLKSLRIREINLGA